ncbi:hypothetical protein [Wenyingzhuangia fucanilytica]|nr:hypothetical protein [Wenyingzhuangia fucanilytica]
MKNQHQDPDKLTSPQKAKILIAVILLICFFSSIAIFCTEKGLL